MLIQFTATEGLLAALANNNIKPEDYRPAYGGESVGLDLFNASPMDIEVPPLERLYPDSKGLRWDTSCMIPSGLKIALPPHHGALILQRGSIKKSPLIHRAGVIDPGWTGETLIQVVNLSKDPFVIPAFAKTPFQIVVMPCITQFAFIDSDTYDRTTRHAQRKEGCIGSSDKQ